MQTRKMVEAMHPQNEPGEPTITIDRRSVISEKENEEGIALTPIFDHGSVNLRWNLRLHFQ
jgi:hypothetical protein